MTDINEIFDGLTEGNNPEFYKYEDVFMKHGKLYVGNLLGSKTLYRRSHPNNEIYFNANIFIESIGKIWWGDLDVTDSLKNLHEIAKEIGEPLYILSEHDGRFGKEKDSWDELKQRARQIIYP